MDNSIRHGAAAFIALCLSTCVLTCLPATAQEFRSSVYQPGMVGNDQPLRLSQGPHLFLDDFYIASSSQVERRVNKPLRSAQIPNPIVTGVGDKNTAPYTTVIRDPESGRYRIWYNSQTSDATYGFAVRTMESLDGIHWIRPSQTSLPLAPGQVGTAVIDRGPTADNPQTRYALGTYFNGGLNIYTSPNGSSWTPLATNPVVQHNHDINNIYFDATRNRYSAFVSSYTTGPTWNGLRRVTMQTNSDDLTHWSQPNYVLTPQDTIDSGETQFYAMQGFLQRGDLWIGMVKVLRDDLVAPGVPAGAFGVGYTTLAWSRDGEHWVRDTAPFFEPDPNVNAWDHAHAWLDYQLPVDDEVYLYYGGYKSGHKWNRFEERQLGLVTMDRDRYVARAAEGNAGTLRTRPLILDADSLTLNADVTGRVLARLVDLTGNPLPGFDFVDFRPIQGDSLEHSVVWSRPLADVQGTPLQIEFHLENARLFGFSSTCQICTREWNVDGMGDWNVPPNWTGGEVPLGAQRIAQFGTKITAPRTVFANAPTTVARIELDSPLTYNLAGAGLITIAGQIDGAGIDVQQGAHVFQAALELSNDAVIHVAAGASLTLDNELALHGHTLIKTGDGQLVINNHVDLAGGVIVWLAGALAGDAVQHGALSGAGAIVRAMDGSVPSPNETPEPGSAYAFGVATLLFFWGRRRPVGEQPLAVVAAPVLRLHARRPRTDRAAALHPQPVAARNPTSTSRATRSFARACVWGSCFGCCSFGGWSLGGPGLGFWGTHDACAQSLEFQSFDSAASAAAAGWNGQRNGDAALGTNFGWANSRLATGAQVGEAGGAFPRLNFPWAYYADVDLAGELSAANALQASGKIYFDTGTFDGGIDVGWFDKDASPQTRTPWLGLETLEANRYRAAIVLDNGVDLWGNVVVGVPHTTAEDFSIAWTPDASAVGGGVLTASITGAQSTITLTPEQTARIGRFDAFGLLTSTATGSSNQQQVGRLLVDDLSYSSNVGLADATWNVNASGDWHESRNWGPSRVPNASDIGAKFGSILASPQTIVADRDVVVRSTEFDSLHGYTLAGLGNVKFQTSDGPAALVVRSGAHQFQTCVKLQNDLSVDVAAAATLSLNNLLDLQGQTLTKTGPGILVVNNDRVGTSGHLQLLAGVLAGHGTIGGHLVNQAGVVAPGKGRGELAVAGNFVQQAAGTLHIEIGGTRPSSDFDALSVGGNATLDGALQASIVSPFSLGPGQSFEIVDIAGSASGAFSGLPEGSLVGTFQGTKLYVTYRGGDGNDVVLRTPSLGDFDLDFDVDGADFLAWQRGQSSNSGSAADLAAWNAHFGPPASPGPAQTAPLPEPSMCWVAVATVAGLSAAKRRTGDVAGPRKDAKRRKKGRWEEERGQRCVLKNCSLPSVWQRA